MNSGKIVIHQDSCLFLDRDGVINRRHPGDYVKTKDDFIFLDGSLQAIRMLSAIFPCIVVVTNQQGIGKGRMSLEDFHSVNDYMLKSIQENGGRIDQVYFAPDLEGELNTFRKPKIGMGLQAKQDFPFIDFTRSVVVGDSDSDMKFGKKLGCTNVLILGKTDYQERVKPDFKFASLLSFAEFLLHT
jgi:histidinol-phosphate phosphatase family protein